MTNFQVFFVVVGNAAEYVDMGGMCMSYSKTRTIKLFLQT